MSHFLPLEICALVLPISGFAVESFVTRHLRRLQRIAPEDESIVRADWLISLRWFFLRYFPNFSRILFPDIESLCPRSASKQNGLVFNSHA